MGGSLTSCLRVASGRRQLKRVAASRHPRVDKTLLKAGAGHHFLSSYGGGGTPGLNPATSGRLHHRRKNTVNSVKLGGVRRSMAARGGQWRRVEVDGGAWFVGGGAVGKFIASLNRIAQNWNDSKLTAKSKTIKSQILPTIQRKSSSGSVASNSSAAFFCIISTKNTWSSCLG